MSDIEELSFEQLIDIQLSLKKQIEKAHSNFKKTPKERLSWNYIETKLSLLDNYWNSFQDNHKLVLQKVDKRKHDYDSYMDTFFEVEDEYAFTRDSMLNKRNNFPNPSQTQIAQASQPKSEEQSIQKLKLPPLQIPSFDGQYCEWISFHDQFVSLVHQNKTLSNVNKLHLLKQNLSGEASNLLKNITITENNYEAAWAKLKKRYSNKRVIVNSYLQKLMSLRIVSNENANAIKSLLDTTTDCLSGLEGIGVNTKTWDPIVIFLVTSKLDNDTLKHWEEKVNEKPDDEMPTYDMLADFMETRFRALEGIQSTKGNMRTTRTIPDRKVFYNSPKEGCIVCNGEHYIFRCRQFIEMTIDDKKRFIEKNKLCFNCLIPNHGAKFCKQKTRCRICGKRHHSLIHTETPNETVRQANSENKTSREIDTQLQLETKSIVNHCSTNAIHTEHLTSCVLLATALVKVTAENGRTLQLRALIDQGSEGSFITEAATQALGLRRQTINGSVSGLGNNIMVQARHSVTFDLQSNNDRSFNLSVNAYVLKSLTRLLPSSQVNNKWRHVEGLQLADPEYGTPAPIDLLLGAEVYNRIMLSGVISGAPDTPLAQKTKLGWILSGGINTNNINNHIMTMHITTHQEDIDILQKFWEIESEDTFKHEKKRTEEEIHCEKIYAETYKRDTEGKYIVEIPFKDKNLDYGDTRQLALKRLEHLERRLNKDTQFGEEYSKVITEYIDLQHMEEIDTRQENINSSKKFYMPHHAIIRKDKLTTKLRIVFDASCKGPKHKSINDNMLIGPKLQQDLRHIVMRWRIHQIAITADCVKMYRQIKVTTESSNYQRILWRVNGEIKDYRLVRVTFGTASAPYLAAKTIQQLAIDEEKRAPTASKIALTDFYMDDLLTGTDTLNEAYKIHTEMTDLMRSGGFELQKWASNSTDFIKYIENEASERAETYVLKLDEVVKTLGIKWNKSKDTFQYDINVSCSSNTIMTKRTILGEISRLFDPIGWLSPVIITAKIIIQKLWLCGVSWDQEVPNEIGREWIQFKEELTQAKYININRWLHTNQNDITKELHGYSDASQHAYAAVIYMRVVKADGSINVRLITARSKVAPIKTISIPRLELCGAVLLTRLLREVAHLLNVSHKDIHAFTDSSIVLAWLQCHPSKWKTFIANRTSEILTNLPSTNWSHVESERNPADVASRGTSPAILLEHKLWWTGPENLKEKVIKYKQIQENITHLEMKKEKITALTNIINPTQDFNLFNRYSNLTKLLRVIAYVLRVFNKQRPKDINLTGEEINKAREICVRLCQAHAFKQEIERLTEGKNVRKDSRIRTLNPFLDSNTTLRVGGRLQNSNLPDHTKHQIILPKSHPFTKLIIIDCHQQTLHGGPMLMLSNLRRRYWIVHAKSLVRQVVHQCVICTRYKAKTRYQIMGSLPESRVTPTKPFLNSGVDFAGPIALRLSKGRGIKTQKGYIVIFICMVTRAVHIEIVTSLNTHDFIAAFKRFVARRGHCSNMWSDNGTNLCAGNKELRHLFDRSHNKLQPEIKNLLANDSTTWHHIPASAPHFGGLWEAGVKSIKFHLRRVLSNTTLTYEEMSTLTAQIEACLNSRPISQMSDHPNDLLPLTPGHFLIGCAPITVPEESYLESNINRLTRWQYTQRMLQDFWNRWSSEYLSRLQQRPKWMTKQPNIKIGDMILLKDDNLPPAKWSLGRIVDVHPGSDDLIRVVSVKCKNSIIKRPVVKVCRLPIDS